MSLNTRISAVSVLFLAVSHSPPPPPLDALQYYARLWTSCGDSSDSNLASTSTPARARVFSFVETLIALLYIP